MRAQGRNGQPDKAKIPARRWALAAAVAVLALFTFALGFVIGNANNGATPEDGKDKPDPPPLLKPQPTLGA